MIEEKNCKSTKYKSHHHINVEIFIPLRKIKEKIAHLQ